MAVHGERYSILGVLIGKEVITNRGDRVGTLSDLIYDSETGKLLYLVVNVFPGSKIAERKGWRGEVKLPVNCLLDIGDVILVDERIIEM
jgi:sporulation protein YlmC with PRC-barrel domain